MLKESLSEAMLSKRLHHQLAPMHIEYESGFDMDIIKGLQSIGHIMHEYPQEYGFVAVSAISIDSEGNIAALSDPRRNGSSAIFYVE